MSRTPSILRQTLLATIAIAGVSFAFLSDDSTASNANDSPGTLVSANVGSGAALTGLGPAEETKAKKPAKKIDPKLGIIEGRVVLNGKPPKFATKVAVPTGHADFAKCAKHVKDERLILGKANGVKNAVVYVADVTAPKLDKMLPGKDYKLKGAKRARPMPNLTIDNKGCMFSPHVSAVTAGTKVAITNSDTFIHNTRGVLAASPLGNRAVAGKGKLPVVRLRKPGWGLVKCDYHSWMTAHVHVFDHECFDVSVSDGSFRIVNVPPGKYKLRVWHEELKNTEIEVTVEAGQTAKTELNLAAYKE
ncbi:MAG: carboxypeptidase regulatory-like domain-containing protein [Planctomycetota bacterium]